MKFVFFGTPRFAEIILDELIRADMPPIALVCNPDRPVGRKHVITPPPTKFTAIKNTKGSAVIEIFQPENFDENFIKKMQALEPDFFVVAAFAKILPKAVLDIPRLGTLGVHPSLLPKLRGASPIQSAILENVPETGVTIYMMDEKTDHGTIIAERKLEGMGDAAGIPIGTIPYPELEKILAEASAKLLVATIPAFLAGRPPLHTQDESQATFTKKIKTEDGYIPSEMLTGAEHGDMKSSEIILRKINAFNPEPGAWTEREGKRIKLLAAEIKNGSLRLIKIQEAGGKPKNI